MARLRKNELAQQVNLGARQYGISTVLFRHAVGERLGVNVTDMECLALIFFKGFASPSELARYTGLTSGATTAMLDRLERARLIDRRPNPSDRRGTLIALTDERTAELDALFGPARQAIARLNAHYTESQLETIAAYFQALVAVWEGARESLLHPAQPKAAR